MKNSHKRHVYIYPLLRKWVQAFAHYLKCAFFLVQRERAGRQISNCKRTKIPVNPQSRDSLSRSYFDIRYSSRDRQLTVDKLFPCNCWFFADVALEKVQTYFTTVSCNIILILIYYCPLCYYVYIYYRLASRRQTLYILYISNAILLRINV